MIYWLFVIFFILNPYSGNAQATPDLVKRDYHGFTLWLDCDQHHGAVAFYYEIGSDRGNISRKSANFKFDRRVPLRCQPQSWRSYHTTTVNPSLGEWDRGHLVPANHMDGSKDTMMDTYFLTNTLPQNKTFNRPGGAWYQTEMITECYREITPLKVWGGVIWGHNPEDDFFTVTHGIETPDHWWKLIYREDKHKYVAWVFPNRQASKASNIDTFLVSIEDLKSRLDFMPDLGAVEGLGFDRRSPDSSWPIKQSREKLTCEGQTTSSG